MLDHARVTAALGTDVYPAARLDQGGGHLHPLKFARRLASMAVAGASTSSTLPRFAGMGRRSLSVRTGKVVAHRVILACDAFDGKSASNWGCSSPTSKASLSPPRRWRRNWRNRLFRAMSPSPIRGTFSTTTGKCRLGGRCLPAVKVTGPRLTTSSVVRPRMLKVFPQLKNISIEFGWSGTVGITRHRMPHFGKIGERAFFAHGYSGHGVALATLGGKVLAQAVLGTRNALTRWRRATAEEVSRRRTSCAGRWLWPRCWH